MELFTISYKKFNETSQFKLAKHLWSIALSDNEQPAQCTCHSSHQMKGANFLTQSNYTVMFYFIKYTKILARGSGGH